ncbi:MAG: hypothetical protein WKF84_16705 [Pyrinomonadaceae bacterium]
MRRGWRRLHRLFCTEGRQADVKAALVAADAEVLNWTVARDGLTVREIPR